MSGSETTGRGAAPAVDGALRDVWDTALGARHRDDPVAPVTGGPAGNARLTAWTGLVLLVAFLVECFTLISLHLMLSLHILLGAALVPMVLLKTATTGWRIARYYLGSDEYRQGGPPPMLLRLLGPLVILTGLAVLGTGLALIALGSATFTTIVSIAGYRIDALTLHQACFAIWAVATGLHALARTVPAAQIAVGARPRHHRPPGAAWRGGILVLAIAVSVGTGLLVLHLAGDWTHGTARASHHHNGGRFVGVVYSRGRATNVVE
jgi:hypothetical protein